MRLRTLENLTVKITFFCKEIPMLIPDKFAQLFSRWSGLMFDILRYSRNLNENTETVTATIYTNAFVEW